MFDRVVFVGLDFVFVFDDLPVKFIDQRIYRCIQVLCEAFDVDVFATDVKIDIGLMAFFFFPKLVYGQDDCNINDLVEVSPYPL